MPLSWDIFLRWLQKILFFKRFFIFFRLRYCPILNFCCSMICCCRYGCFYCSSCCFGLSSVLMIGDFCFQILTEHLCFVRLSAEQVPIFLHFRCCGLVFHFSELWLLVSIPVWVFRYIFPDFRGFLHFFPHWYCGCRSDKSCYRGFLHRIDCCFHLNVRGSDSPLCYCWSDGCFPSDDSFVIAVISVWLTYAVVLTWAVVVAFAVEVCFVAYIAVSFAEITIWVTNSVIVSSNWRMHF